jgi:hypothetical protein
VQARSLQKNKEKTALHVKIYMGELLEKEMKRVIITAVVLFASPAWALTHMGSPTSNVKQGALILGFDYSDSETDIDVSGYGLNGTFEDVESDLYMAKVGIGVFDRIELFGRFGSSEIEDLGNEFAWGLGTKATLGRQDALSWGALFQLTALTAKDTENLFGFLLNGEMNVYEFQIAFGPRYDIGGLYVYGGPFFHFISGNIDLEFLGYTASFDIKQESEFGGYIGLGWQIAENSSLSVEYQSTGNAEAVGVGLVHRFGGSAE